MVESTAEMIVTLYNCPFTGNLNRFLTWKCIMNYCHQVHKCTVTAVQSSVLGRGKRLLLAVLSTRSCTCVCLFRRANRLHQPSSRMRLEGTLQLGRSHVIEMLLLILNFGPPLLALHKQTNFFINDITRCPIKQLPFHPYRRRNFWCVWSNNTILSEEDRVPMQSKGRQSKRIKLSLPADFHCNHPRKFPSNTFSRVFQ